ncbi:MAG: transposase [Pseudohongiellaceae bacterium]
MDKTTADNWTTDEVIERWVKLFKADSLTNRYLAGEPLNSFEHATLIHSVELWRQRLNDLSWYMRCLNERIARMANFEDKCSGRFWEGRFKSQALLDEAAVISCMAYVDLNPIRANLCSSLESSEFTSIQERLQNIRGKSRLVNAINSGHRERDWLKPLCKEGHLATGSVIPIADSSYFALVDWTGRTVQSNGKGRIPDHITPVLAKLGINEENWTDGVRHFGSRFKRVIGHTKLIKRFALRQNQNWIVGLAASGIFYL